jgi:hypothetical protein
MSDRAAVIARFLDRNGWGDARREPLAGDASFRRYERLRRGSEVAVLMDAPPPHEDVRPFVRVGRALAALGLGAPAIMAEDTEAGLLLLEDLGNDTYTRVLAADPKREESLYALATDALIALHRGFRLPADGIPRFTDDRAVAEALRMLEWLWPVAKGRPAPADAEASFRAAWREVLPAWRGVPDSLILYDFHVDNLILRPGRKGVQACGLLDFQDGVIGPIGFDLMSLVQDVRRDVPARLAQRLIDRYLAAFPELDREAYLASYAVGGAQRNVRILGTFVRLWKRDGKPGYLAWLPRTWRMVEFNLAHPALEPLARWFDLHFPPALRASPLPGAPSPR